MRESGSLTRTFAKVLRFCRRSWARIWHGASCRHPQLRALDPRTSALRSAHLVVRGVWSPLVYLSVVGHLDPNRPQAGRGWGSQPGRGPACVGRSGPVHRWASVRSTSIRPGWG
jgi:hypothetical protein